MFEFDNLFFLLLYQTGALTDCKFWRIFVVTFWGLPELVRRAHNKFVLFFDSCFNFSKHLEPTLFSPLPLSLSLCKLQKASVALFSTTWSQIFREMAETRNWWFYVLSLGLLAALLSRSFQHSLIAGFWEVQECFGRATTHLYYSSLMSKPFSASGLRSLFAKDKILLSLRFSLFGARFYAKTGDFRILMFNSVLLSVSAVPPANNLCCFFLNGLCEVQERIYCVHNLLLNLINSLTI